MSWWRHESTLSPLQRSARRLLRSHEAALRIRCFSRSPYKALQHEDGGGNRRPAHLSNLEWMQLQHYKRWRKRLTEDPYHALFGASNDMLSGRGLKDWEWAYSSFPRWLVGEWGEGQETKRMQEQTKPNKAERPIPETRPDAQARAPSSSPQSPHYPKRVEIQDHNILIPRTESSNFAQPSSKSFRLDGDETGISSPSDPRRPREPHPIKPFDNDPAPSSASPGETVGKIPDYRVPPPPRRVPLRLSEWPRNSLSKNDFADEGNNKESSAEASARESSFIEEFLSGGPQSSIHANNHRENKTIQRQSAVERQSSSELGDWYDLKYNSENRRDMPKAPIQRVPDDISEMQHLEEFGSENKAVQTKKVTRDVDWLVQQNPPVHESKSQSETDPIPAPSAATSTQKVSKDLSSSDIDSLSAADIRATMGRKRRTTSGFDREQWERDVVRETFVPTRAAKSIGNYAETKNTQERCMRRCTGEEQGAPVGREIQEKETKNERLNSASAMESNAESSMDRIKKWFEQGSAILTNHFWQDPSEEADVQIMKKSLEKAVKRIQKGRVAMQQVIEDLETDIPSTKSLLKRLKEDEGALDSAVQALRFHLTKGTQPGPSPTTSRGTSRLHSNLQAVEDERDAAYKALSELRQPDAAESASPAFKRRLRIASKTSHLNANLTYYLYLSLQNRPVHPEFGQSFLDKFRAVSNSLFILRDTQTAIAGVVDRAMLVYGVVPAPSENFQIPGGADGVRVAKEFQDKSLTWTTTLGNKDHIRTNVAIEESIANEAESQKLATQDFAEEVEAKASPSNTRKSFDDQSPLARSLFRPFGSVLENLGKEENGTESIHEVKKLDGKQAKNLTSFEMLKDDPTSCSLPNSDLDPSTYGNLQNGAIYPGNTPEGCASMASDVLERESMHEGIESPSEVDTAALPINEASTSHLPTHYTILIHDPQTDNFSLTTSTAGPPRDTSPTMPIHQALSILDAPSKFVPYITDGLEIVSAKKDMLILRNALNDAASTRSFETLGASSSSHAAFEDMENSKRQVNPIDGTVRLSPTGYVGPEESQEQLEQEFQERRQAAGQINTAEAMQRLREAKCAGRKEHAKRRGGVGAVVRTAIWAGALCYVVGVVGEICISPFRM